MRLTIQREVFALQIAMEGITKEKITLHVWLVQQAVLLAKNQRQTVPVVPILH